MVAIRFILVKESISPSRKKTMSDTFTIGQLAKIAKVPASTLRYYEQEELLVPVGRTDSNYRLYGAQSLEQLRFIRAAQASGFTLEDIATLISLQKGVLSPCGDVESLVEHRLREVTERLTEMRHLKKTLKMFKLMCRDSSDSEDCAVLDELAHPSK